LPRVTRPKGSRSARPASGRQLALTRTANWRSRPLRGDRQIGEVLLVDARDRGEVAAQIEVGARRGQRVDAETAVHVRAPGRVERTGRGVERGDVVTRHGVGAVRAEVAEVVVVAAGDHLAVREYHGLDVAVSLRR